MRIQCLLRTSDLGKLLIGCHVKYIDIFSCKGPSTFRPRVQDSRVRATVNSGNKRRMLNTSRCMCLTMNVYQQRYAENESLLTETILRELRKYSGTRRRLTRH